MLLALLLKVTGLSSEIAQPRSFVYNEKQNLLSKPDHGETTSNVTCALFLASVMGLDFLFCFAGSVGIV